MLKESLPITFAKCSEHRCKVCKVRYKKNGIGLCDYCYTRAERKSRMTPAIVEKIVLGLVEPRYADAVITKVDTKVRDELRKRETEQDVFIWGKPGRGKTYIFAALIRAYTEVGYECARISFDEFCCQVRSTMQPAAKQTEWELTGKLKSVDLLFIDDMGISTKRASDFTYNTLFLILNKRQERLLPTFISSNKNPETLSKTLFDVRILSRLSAALTIEITGKDRRELVP